MPSNCRTPTGRMPAVNSLFFEVTPGPPAADTVILSNSLGTTLHMWDSQVELLRTRFRVVRYDARGHGRSPLPDGLLNISDLADDVVGLMDVLRLPRAHFVGLSLGGMTGLDLAVRHPDRIDRLVVMCSSARLGPPEAWHRRAEAVRAGGMQAISDDVVRRWFTSGFRQRRPDVIAEAKKMLDAAPASGYAAVCDLIANLDQRAVLPCIAAPTLAIAGAEDRATPVAHLREIAEHVEDGTLHVAPDCAHMAPCEQPRSIATAVLAHLTGTA